MIRISLAHPRRIIFEVENQRHEYFLERLQDDAEDFPNSGGGRDLVGSDCQTKARLEPGLVVL